MITDIFDAIRDGSYEDFREYYDSNIENVDKYTGLNLLLTAMVNSKNPIEKIKIIQTLIKEGIDINYTSTKYHRNALHTLYFNALRSDAEYLEKVVDILITAKIDLNAKDIYQAIPLKYAITVCKNTTSDMEQQYKHLIKCGSDYNHKDKFGKSCLDYAKELTWRIDFLKFVEVYENEN